MDWIPFSSKIFLVGIMVVFFGQLGYTAPPTEEDVRQETRDTFENSADVNATMDEIVQEYSEEEIVGMCAYWKGIQSESGRKETLNEIKGEFQQQMNIIAPMIDKLDGRNPGDRRKILKEKMDTAAQTTLTAGLEMLKQMQEVFGCNEVEELNSDSFNQNNVSIDPEIMNNENVTHTELEELQTTEQELSNSCGNIDSLNPMEMQALTARKLTVRLKHVETADQLQAETPRIQTCIRQMKEIVKMMLTWKRTPEVVMRYSAASMQAFGAYNTEAERMRQTLPREFAPIDAAFADAFK